VTDLTRPVPLELVKECLEVALQAPTGGNRQGWHWLVITEAPQTTLKRVRSSSEHLAAHMADVPALTLHLQYEREVSQLLGIPSHVRQGVLLPTAYYTGETFRPAPREPLESVLHVDRW